MARILGEEPKLILLLESRKKIFPVGPIRQRTIAFCKEVAINLRKKETKIATAEAGISGSLMGAAGAIINNAIMPPISDRISRFASAR